MTTRAKVPEAGRRLAPLVSAGLFVAALWVLRRELRAVRYDEVTAALFALPATRVVLATLLTAANYAVLTLYDQLGFAYVGRRIERGRIALAGFVAYAISNSVGFGLLSGASVRYRFYSRWGLTASELSRLVLFTATTFWLGLLLLGGASLALAPPAGVEILAAPGVVRGLGALLLAAALAYATAARLRRRTLRLRQLDVAVPEGRLVAAQFLVSTLDWTLAAAVLYALLPSGGVAFPRVLSAFLAAQILGLVSHLPGGLGVFESAMVVLLKTDLSARVLLPVLVLYRLIYYIAPLALAMVVLGADELVQRRERFRRMRALFGSVAQEITPRLLAVFTFLAGAVLLFSGATPAASGRLALIERLLPLGVIEASHFLGSIVGVGLLIVSQGLARRLDAAFYLAAGGLVLGIAVSLLKGGDYEEAAILALILAALLESRPRFDRRAAFFATRFSPGWIAAVLGVVAASIWLGLFAFQHVQYSSELWWQFELKKEAARSLRAGVGVALSVLVFGALRLMRPAPPEVALPTDEDLARAARVIESQQSTLPYLVYLRDKALLFDAEQRAFVMYAVQGRTWVALGDPVGPPERGPALIRAFVERCDDYGGNAVFYEVGRERLHQYADFGLALLKIGEEARLDLACFSLEGHENKPLRQAARRLEKDAASFRIAPPEDVRLLLPALREVSDEWRADKRMAEKGFSLGYFDSDYLAQFPVALVERNGRIEAFANVWPGPGGVELSVDLMRHRSSAPNGVMDALFVRLMLWGKEKGYRSFVLGMAPLAGLEGSAVAPFWHRLGRFLYGHGEAFYNFQGLRAYKEKFRPHWEPRYLAYVGGGPSLPRILADLAALIAGGYGRILGS